MTRITPRRFTTLQCSQIGFTLLRTFKTASSNRFKTDPKPTRALKFAQADYPAPIHWPPRRASITVPSPAEKP